MKLATLFCIVYLQAFWCYKQIKIVEMPYTSYTTKSSCDSCNMGMSDLPDMWAADPICGPQTLGLRAYISVKSQVPMLQLICNTFLASCTQAKSLVKLQQLYL